MRDVDNERLPDPLSGLLRRVDALRNGLLASTCLGHDAAIVEAVLVLDDALERSRRALVDDVTDPDGLSPVDVRLLLAAERYWLEILRDMLVAGEDLPAPVRLRRVLASMPG